MPETVILHADESGNTGHDLLKPDQPHFVYAMLETTEAQRAALTAEIQKLRARLGRSAPKEFKYRDLKQSNPGRKVSLELARLATESGAALHLAFVEKRYQLCSMVVETYADAGGPLELETVLVRPEDRRRLAQAIYSCVPDMTLNESARAVMADDAAALLAIGARIRGIIDLHPSAQTAALAKHLELCASEPFRFGERMEDRPKHAE
jgi:hypothetical protein